MDEIRGRLREIRRRVGLSQGEFAAKMGIKQNTWSNIEHGVNPCSDRYINLVCLTFKVRKEWLTEREGDVFTTNFGGQPLTPVFEDNDEPLPPDVAELIQIYQELVPLNQKAVIDFLETTLQSQRNTLKTINNNNPPA